MSHIISCCGYALSLRAYGPQVSGIHYQANNLWLYVTTITMTLQLVLSSIPVFLAQYSINVTQVLPYKIKYWRGVNFGDWRFYRKIANI